jgi:hypothetical protein
MSAVRLLASQLLATAGDVEGDFVFATIDARGGAPQHYAIANGPDAAAAIEELVARIGSEPHQNTYFAGSLFRSGSVNTYKGRTKENVVGALCAVTDFDAKNDPATRHKRLPAEPGSELESSAGNFHCHYWLDRPYPGEKIQPVLYALAAAAGADDCKSTEHLWRVPGTWNWPDRKKLATGRASEPFLAQWSVMPDAWNTISAIDLRSAILKTSPDAFHRAPTSAVSDRAFDWTKRRKPQEPVNEQEIARALTNEGDRSALAFKLIRKLQRSGYSGEEVLAALLKFSNLPVMKHYGDPVSEDRVKQDVQRAYAKPDDAMSGQRTARMLRVLNSLTDATQQETPRTREIKMLGGCLPAVVDEAEQALIEQSIGIFQRGSMLVRPGELLLELRGGDQARDLVLVPVGVPEMIEHMTSAATFVRWDARKQDWNRINCPREIAEALLARIGRWQLRPLIATINAPTLRPDGSMLDQPGYDRETRLLYDPRGATFPKVPSQPTKGDAERSLAVLETLIAGFPFASREARAVAFAGMLTACIRRSLPTAPIFGIDGTGPGTGKGLLADTIAIIGNGRAASPITAGSGEEELEKRVASMLIRGDLAICIDNLDRPLESTFLLSALTQETQSVRVLGHSKTVTLPTNCLFLATGNGLTFAGEMWRRGLNCLIDPVLERPSERHFNFSPKDLAKRDRGKYVAAALTVLRAYWCAGRPEQDGKLMGSFEEWCRAVRDPLLWLGEADAAATSQPASDDPERERFSAVIEGWKGTIGEDRGVTLQQAIEEAEMAARESPPRKAFHEALHAVAATMVRGGEHRVDARRLGYWMRRMKRQVIRGRRLVPEGESHSGLRWRLEVAQRGAA